ncbi:hypothetical protein OG401_10445 [Kitasatospora purpeofusca]|uniref:hypothetical protein n=1 Tax=Kitasatospora purpeofusca TaxID=67352 RepID=UPI002257AE04|nr:hypothetical protein [Kitasatospora purpeofusca]MCX4684724.1 hypothetical protein [Kitasatospora purpeofusca]
MTTPPRATPLHRPADHLTARRCDCGVCRALARRCRWLVRRVGGSVAGRRRASASVAP